MYTSYITLQSGLNQYRLIVFINYQCGIAYIHFRIEIYEAHSRDATRSRQQYLIREYARKYILARVLGDHH